MKAWQFTGTNKPLQLNEVPEPHAGPGQVVVEVKAAGVCHSDVTALDDPGWMPLFFELPRTMGHENAGVITEVGINGTASGGVTTYPVKVQISQTEGLLPGMNVDVSIVISQESDALAVPADAVLSGSRVLVKTADGSTGTGAPAGYKYVRVEVGVSNEDYVQILSGLEAGAEIAYPMTTSLSIFDMMQMGPGAMGQMGPGQTGGRTGGTQMGGGPRQ